MSEKNSYENYSKINFSSTSSSPKRRSTRLQYLPEFTILESPNHKATVDISLKRIPDGSMALSPVSRNLETKWNNRFNVVFSKQNHHVYSKLREFFDTPKKVDDVQGATYRGSSSSSPQKRIRRKTTRNPRETMWDTRYSFTSECNEVTHKTLRNYFNPDAHLPQISKNK